MKARILLPTVYGLVFVLVLVLRSASPQNGIYLAVFLALPWSVALSARPFDMFGMIVALCVCALLNLGTLYLIGKCIDHKRYDRTH